MDCVLVKGRKRKSLVFECYECGCVFSTKDYGKKICGDFAFAFDYATCPECGSDARETDNVLFYLLYLIKKHFYRKE